MKIKQAHKTENMKWKAERKIKDNIMDRNERKKSGKWNKIKRNMNKCMKYEKKVNNETRR